MIDKHWDTIKHHIMLWSQNVQSSIVQLVLTQSTPYNFHTWTVDVRLTYSHLDYLVSRPVAIKKIVLQFDLPPGKH